MTEAGPTDTASSLAEGRCRALLDLPGLAEDVAEKEFLQRAMALVESLTGSASSTVEVVEAEAQGPWPAGPTSKAALSWAEHQEEGAELRRHLAVPIRDRSRVVMVLGLEGKETDYTEDDAETVRILGEGIWTSLCVVRSRRAAVQSVRLLNEAGALAKVGGWAIERDGTPRWTEETYRIHDVPVGSPVDLEKALSFFHPDDRATLGAAVEVALEEGKPYDLELRMTTAAGRKIWTRALCHPEVVDGKVVRLLGAFMDITHRKEAEFESSRLAHIVAHASDAMALVDTEYRYLAVNPTYAQLFNMAPEDFDGWNLHDAVGDQHFEEHIRPLAERCMLHGELTDHESWAELVGREPRCYRVRYAPYRDSCGEIRGFVISARDETDRKRVEEERADSLKKLALAVSSGRLGVWRIDLEKDAVEWSEELCTMYGLTQENAPRDIDSWRRLIHPADLHAAEEAIDSLRAGSTLEGFEYRIIRPNGSVRHLRASGGASVDEAGTVVEIVGVNQDITKRREAEARLELAARRQQALARRLTQVREEERAMVARELHDEVGQALTAAKMDVATLLRSVPDPPEQLLEKARALSELLERGIDTVQDLSLRLRSPVLDVLGLESAVRDQAAKFSNRFDIECRVSVSGPLGDIHPSVSISALRITQEALTNIARHAGASSVDVFLGTQNGELVVRVDDDGIGIHPDALYAISSLGLLGIQERAEALMGSVEIGRRPDGGTRVNATLPLEQPEAPTIEVFPE